MYVYVVQDDDLVLNVFGTAESAQAYVEQVYGEVEGFKGSARVLTKDQGWIYTGEYRYFDKTCHVRVIRMAVKEL